MAIPTQIKEIIIGSNMLQMEVVAEPEKLLDEITHGQFVADDERLPYWSELWPSAIALAEYILENPDFFIGKSCIELGCGLGLSGIAALQAGGRVTFSDYEQQALTFTDRNCRLNGFNDQEMLLLDWRNPPVNQKYDVVIAADVLYEKRFLHPVLNTISALLSDTGLVLLAEPNRSVALPFFEDLKDRDAKVERFPRTIQYEGSPRNVSIIKIG